MVVPKFPYPIVGGLENQAFLLSKELLKKDVKISVLSLKHGNSNKKINGINIKRLSENFFGIKLKLILIPKILAILDFLPHIKKNLSSS